MSRDWTPQQLHAVDKQMNGSLHEQVITWAYNGESITIHDPNSEDGKTFPNFYFLGCDVFKRLKEKCSIKFMSSIEMVLAEIIDIVDGFDSPCDSISDEMLEQNIKLELMTLAKLVRDWFEGKLDPGFYYNEWNNELFVRNLLEIFEDAPRCDKCEFVVSQNNHDGKGVRRYCKLSDRDVSQSHFGMNSPRTCPRRCLWR